MTAKGILDNKTLMLRADASVAMGTGHVMRCLALAQAWQDAGGKCAFAMAQTTAGVEERLRAEGIEVLRLEGPPGTAAEVEQFCQISTAHGADWVVIDGYQFGAEYQHMVKQAGLKLLFIDDNGHADLYCAHLVLNQNAHASEVLYPERGPSTKLLLGPRYAMLRREFAKWRHWGREIPEVARKVLVMMGGSDPDNVTAMVIEGLRQINVDGLEVTVVVGGSNPHFESLERMASGFQGTLRLERGLSHMAERMAWADVAVSGAGTTCLEMCLLGLPAILIVLAENQRSVAHEMDKRGAAVRLDDRGQVSGSAIAAKLEQMLLSKRDRASISDRARRLVDGYGVKRVVSAMYSSSLRIRPADEKDCRLLWEWANDPNVRKASFTETPIVWEQHQAWFTTKMKDPSCRILIGEDAGGRAVGQFRVERRSDHEGEIDVSLASDLRGGGVGSLLIEKGVSTVFATTGIWRLHAFIRPENRASLGAFEVANFAKVGEEEVKGHMAVHYVRERDPKQT